MDSKPVLHYWPMWGRAETIRMLLWVNKMDWDEKNYPRYRVEPEKWAEAKKDLEFGALPRLDIDGLQLVQSKAIERYLVNKFNMVPESLKDRYLVDSMIDLHLDMIGALFPYFTTKPEDQPAFIENYVEKELTPKLVFIEKRVKDCGSDEFMVGGKLSHVDICNIWLLDTMRAMFGTNEKVMKSLETAPAYCKLVDTLKPKTFKEYIDNVRKPFSV